MKLSELKPGDLVGNSYHAWVVADFYDGVPRKTSTPMWYVPGQPRHGKPYLPLPEPIQRSSSEGGCDFGHRSDEVDRTEYVFRDGVQIWPK